jgi:hypothetical protein
MSSLRDFGGSDYFYFYQNYMPTAFSESALADEIMVEVDLKN